MANPTLAGFATKPYTIHRFTESTFAHGVRVDQAPSTLTVYAIVLPLSGYEMANLPEGMIAEETKKFLANVEVFTSKGREPDRVVIDGDDYVFKTVKKVEVPWSSDVYYFCMVSLYQPGQL